MLPIDMAASFHGKVITITGAASGIGLATARVLFSRGASLALSDVNGPGLQTVEEGLSAHRLNKSQKLTTSVVDVSDPSEVDAWIADAIHHHGQINGSALVAGRGQIPEFLAEIKDNEFDRMIDINLRGTFNCMRAQLQHLRPGSSVVGVSSGAGVHGVARSNVYGAAKAGVIGLIKSAAREYGQQGVRFNAVAPGLINTMAVKEAGGASVFQHMVDMKALKRIGEPEEVATVIAFLLSEDSSFITGEVLNTDGGLRC